MIEEFVSGQRFAAPLILDRKLSLLPELVDPSAPPVSESGRRGSPGSAGRQSVAKQRERVRVRVTPTDDLRAARVPK